MEWNEIPQEPSYTVTEFQQLTGMDLQRVTYLVRSGEVTTTRVAPDGPLPVPKDLYEPSKDELTAISDWQLSRLRISLTTLNDWRVACGLAPLSMSTATPHRATSSSGGHIEQHDVVRRPHVSHVDGGYTFSFMDIERSHAVRSDGEINVVLSRNGAIVAVEILAAVSDSDFARRADHLGVPEDIIESVITTREQMRRDLGC